MNRAIIFTMIFVLCASFALAEILVITPETTNEESNKLFLVENTNSGIKIEALEDVGATYIFVNEKLVEEFESFEAEDTKSIRFDRSRENEVEIRFIKEYSYTWENYDITKNDMPINLEYLKYDKEDKYVKFTLGGADIVHPNIIDSTKRSVEESLTDYVVKVDDEFNINCYPKISTGSNLYFKCKYSSYPHIIDITTTVGVSEKTIIGPSIVQTIVEEKPEPVVEEAIETIVEEEAIEIETIIDEENNMLLQEEDQGNTSAPEETEVLDNINMTDTILESSGMSNSVKFFILTLFLTVLTLFFIASHHKHENKKAGKHHPYKKSSKKNKK